MNSFTFSSIYNKIIYYDTKKMVKIDIRFLW
jgi:hypothetical protein